MAGLLVSLAASCFITFIAVTTYAISSFGNGMIFHMGWQLCSRIGAGSVCSGEISTANVLITVAAFFVLPVQLYLLFHLVDWKLGLNLSFTQQIGVFIGMYISFVVHSDWVARGLGISMLAVAIQKTLSEINTIRTGSIQPPIVIYEFKEWKDYILVWIVGISSGFFGGLYASGGPPLMWFVATVNLEKNMCRGTIAFLYLIENFGRIVFIVLYSPDNEILAMRLPSLLLLITAYAVTSMIALAVGSAAVAAVDQQCFRYLILAMLGFGSVLLTTTGYSTTGSLYIVLIAALIYCMLYIYYLSQTSASGRGSVSGRVVGIADSSFELIVGNLSKKIPFSSNKNNSGNLSEPASSNAAYTVVDTCCDDEI